MAEIENPGDLTGRTVEFVSIEFNRKPKRLRGTVVGTARIPGVVMISDKPGHMYSRPVSEIEVIS